MQFIGMQKLIINIGKIIIKIKNHHIVSNSCGWAIFQKLPVGNFEWIEDTSNFKEDFIKNYNEESDQGYFLEVEVQYPEILHKLHNDLPIFSERKKI